MHAPDFMLQWGEPLRVMPLLRLPGLTPPGRGTGRPRLELAESGRGKGPLLSPMETLTARRLLKAGVIQ